MSVVTATFVLDGPCETIEHDWSADADVSHEPLA